MRKVPVGEKLAIARRSQVPKVTQRRVADILGLESRSTYANWEVGIAEPPAEVVARLAARWQIPIEWFYDGTESPIPARLPRVRDLSPPYVVSALGAGKIPHWGKVPAGDFEPPTQDAGGTDVPAPYANPEKYVTFAVVNDSMEPNFRPGDIIIVELTKKPTYGRAVIAHYEGGLAFKRLKMTPDGPRLVPDNPIYEPIDPRDGIEYLGQVVFVMRDQGL